jgi:hypothetical protein
MADHLALDHGIPTTADDVAALRRPPRRVELAEYLRFLAAVADTPGALPRRRGPMGAPFELRAGGEREP